MVFTFAQLTQRIHHIYKEKTKVMFEKGSKQKRIQYLKLSTMKTIINNIFKVLFYISIYLVLIVCFLYFIAFVAFTKNQVLDVPVLRDYQRYFYFQTRNILQNDNDCIEFDSKLIYRLKDGRCTFNNTEFQTTINVFNNQREVPASNGTSLHNSIAVLGDSYALGWGVSDDETFSNLVSADRKQKVQNFGVSSYGTYRELLAFTTSSDIGGVNIIVLQYCVNDLEENQTYLLGKYEKNSFRSIFSSMITEESAKKRKNLLTFDFARRAFTIPVNRIENAYARSVRTANDRVVESQAQMHQTTFESVIREFRDLGKYKVLVLVFGSPEDSNFRFEDKTKLSSLTNIHYLNLELEREDYFVLDDHWNKRGHSKVAGQILKKLQELNW
jgi:hypothetical protein